MLELVKPLHRFGLGFGFGHHMSNELEKIGNSMFLINAGGFVCLFVCNHIVFSHVVAMTNYLLPSDAKHQPDGVNPVTLKVLQKNIKNGNKNQEQKDW
jgi:hypothetical protein